ncbi:alpha/beta fold hydrolase [Streptacidiphilus sp. P02-A3a]|uniref:alpha/beta fold hydrolase n=1 Tax=Streptacidiphilus sp. P02-A3a TaxID=2704468 RepID=UPI0015FBE9F4|nr:alpha/beta hydrolase [Streptacidiphilus sp. P02-A3a]QMU73651.1 alpha/beta hydrolase [Streptacidiphilus sp. P02-A3a]
MLPEEFRVPVVGGELAVLRWAADRPDAPVVLALHGITGNGLCWGPVAERLAGRVTLVAPDLRGRAGSAAIEGPFGVAAHADDVAALAAALDLPDVLLVGHSMGAFVAALAAVRHPALVRWLLLVDGAVGFPLPTGLPPDELIGSVIGPAMTRLSMTFPDRAAYRAFWQRHPALAGAWSPWVDAYTQRDLVGTEPELRSSCRLDAVRVDGIDLFEPEVLAAVHRLPCPAELLWAARGLMDEPQGLYDEQRLTAAGLDRERVVSRPVPDTNHYTVLIGAVGAATVAERLLAAAGVAD